MTDDITLNAGIRYEVFDIRMPAFYDYGSLDSSNYDYRYLIVREDRFVKSRFTDLLLPRFSLAYANGENKFYIAFGKYTQMPALYNLLNGNIRLGYYLIPLYRPGYWTSFTRTPGFFSKPEQSVHVEAGIGKWVTEALFAHFRVYHKTLTNQLQLGELSAPEGQTPVIAYVNEGNAAAIGMELSLEFVRPSGMSLRLDYAFSSARGKTSNPTSNAGAFSPYTDVPIFPEQIYPLDYEQSHRATGYVHYSDGHATEPWNILAVLSFNSGHPYTRVAIPPTLGSASVWRIGVRPLMEAASANPTEFPNSSTTPWFFNVDIHVGKRISFQPVTIELFLNVLNVFNTRDVMNVYPTTGTTSSDGWLETSTGSYYSGQFPRYEEFYRAINLMNRWAYIGATGYDLYGSPRQIRIGMEVGL